MSSIASLLSPETAALLAASYEVEVPAVETATLTVPTQPTATPSEARQWLRENGHEVGQRGRIDATLLTIFETETGRTVETAPTATRSAVPTTDIDSKAIRAWAIENGVEVGQRGRIHPEVIAAYNEAHAA